MNTIKIEIPKGYEIDSFDKLSGEIKLKELPKDVMGRIRTVYDVLNDNSLTLEQWDKEKTEGLSDDEMAYRMLKLLVKSLNEGWEPDWNDKNQPKYYPWFEMGGSSGFRFRDYVHWNSGSLVGSRLCFKSKELAIYAGKQFTDVYARFMLK